MAPFWDFSNNGFLYDSTDVGDSSCYMVDYVIQIGDGRASGRVPGKQINFKIGCGKLCLSVLVSFFKEMQRIGYFSKYGERDKLSIQDIIILQISDICIQRDVDLL